MVCYLHIKNNADKNFLFRHFRSPLIKDEFFDNDEDYFEKYFSSISKNIPIIIYFHGNAFDRYK
jgi:hypothetical protein